MGSANERRYYIETPGVCLLHQLFMMTSSNGTFSALLAFCAGNSPVTGDFPSQRSVTWSFDVFFDPRLNKRLGEQSGRRWFETPSRSLWVTVMINHLVFPRMSTPNHYGLFSALLALLWGKRNGHRWIPFTKYQWYGSLMSPSMLAWTTVGQAIQLPVIWNVVLTNIM